MPEKNNNWTSTYKVIHLSKHKDFVGHDKTDTETACLMDQLYLVDSEFALKPLTANGAWNLERDETNKIRENDSAEISRQKSLESVGLVFGLRKSPWTVMPHPDRKGPEKLLHWGTLFGGLKRAWLADIKKENKVVQLAVNSTYAGTKRYPMMLKIINKGCLQEVWHSVFTKLVVLTYLPPPPRTLALRSN